MRCTLELWGTMLLMRTITPKIQYIPLIVLPHDSMAHIVSMLVISGYQIP